MTTNMDSYLGVLSLAFPVDCRKPRLKAHPDVLVTLAGDADERGDIVYNLALSDRRAIATRDRLSSNWESPPIASCSPPDGASCIPSAQNPRRVAGARIGAPISSPGDRANPSHASRASSTVREGGGAKRLGSTRHRARDDRRFALPCGPEVTRRVSP